MKPRLLILLILNYCLCLNLSAQTIKFSVADGSGKGSLGGFAEWNFQSGANRYKIKQNGRGKRATTSFQLPFGKDETVMRVYFAAYKNDLIVVYEANGGDYGTGYVASFNSANLKLKWKAGISGFNVGQGLIENQFAYLTAIGFIAKINLTTGKYVWKHHKLYGWNKNNGAFNSFEVPEFDGQTIIFTEKTNDDKTNIIVADKTTGKIIRTILSN